MKTRRWLVFPIIRWLIAAGIVFGIGLYWFPKEYSGMGLIEAFYFSLRLFILEHDLPTFPKSWPLIFIYFFAPLVSLSVLGTVIRYIFRISPLLKTKFQKNHVIICGLGRTGKLLAETLYKRGIPIVGVDSGDPESFDEWCAVCRIPVIFGNFLSKPVLERAGAYKARTLIFAAGDDLLNLEAVVSAYGWLKTDTEPVKLLWAHIASEKLAMTARRALRTRGKVGIRLFDTYRIAAKRMLKKYFSEDVRKDVKEINILGFGKFGRDLMEMIVRDLDIHDSWKINIVDIKDKEKGVYLLANELGVPSRVEFRQENIEDIEISDKPDKAFFLCTDDDIGNLATALTLTRNIRGTHIYVRMAKWPISAIEEHLQDECGLTFININDLVVEGIDDLPGIFEPAQSSDIKRSGSSPDEAGCGAHEESANNA